MLDATFHAGKGIRTFEINLSPNLTGEINLTAVASNAVSEVSNFTLFRHYYAINGFFLLTHPSTVFKNAEIVLIRENSARLPQGNVSITLQYGDGNVTVLSIDAGNSSFLNPGYIFPYRYLAEGEYNVVVNITSLIDKQTLNSKLEIVEPIQNISVSFPFFCFRIDSILKTYAREKAVSQVSSERFLI